MSRMQRLFLFVIAAAVIGGGCSSDSSDPVISIPQIPVPFGLSAVIGTADIVLSWQADASFTYSRFVIYKSEDSGAIWNKIGESTTQSFTDSTVRTGATYLYGVSG
ncbi:MAG: hypothetical protein KAT30_08805, partial [Candidatus Krumholzibacteria bacterium]|nr:hypothetical protein [Candidatus Krumholzibacteria bacterium]